MNFTNYNEQNDQQNQFPIQIQQLVDQINTLYQDLDDLETEIEDQLRNTLKLKRKNAQKFSQLKNQLESTALSKIELLKVQIQKLQNMKTDALIKLNNNQANLLQVLISRLLMNAKGKQQAFQMLIGQIVNQLAQIQYDVDEDSENAVLCKHRENEQLLTQEIELAKHEEELDKDQQDIRIIHKNVNEIMDIIDTISVEVHNQGQVVNQIEEKVIQADQNMDEGLDKLLKAQSNQKLSKKAKCVMVIVCSIAVVLLVIIILAVVL